MSLNDDNLPNPFFSVESFSLSSTPLSQDDATMLDQASTLNMDSLSFHSSGLEQPEQLVDPLTVDIAHHSMSPPDNSLNGLGLDYSLLQVSDLGHNIGHDIHLHSTPVTITNTPLPIELVRRNYTNTNQNCDNSSNTGLLQNSNDNDNNNCGNTIQNSNDSNNCSDANGE